jgi:hypothetical protein
MEKVLISLPDQLATRMRATMPARQRSKIITHLIEEEIERRERVLYECAVAVEKDRDLHLEMEEWDITLRDGLNDNKKTSIVYKAKKSTHKKPKGTKK